MDGRGMAAVALRMWGLVLLLGSVAALPGSILLARASPGPPEQAEFIRGSQNAVLFQLTASVILGLCLLLWADAVTRWFIPETPSIQVGVDMSQLLTVGLVLVGVGILIQGLGDSVASGYVLMRKPQGAEPGPLSYLWERQSETLVRAVVDMVAGTILVLGRARLARGWAQVRSMVKAG
jgi:hypothetical protein